MASTLRGVQTRRKGAFVVDHAILTHYLLRMKHRFTILPLVLSGCAELGLTDQIERPGPEPETEIAVVPELAAPPPPTNARTVDQFDTTTEEQKVAAASPPAGGRLLGTTVASLGDPSRAGFWIETPLATDPGEGRIVYPANGKSVQVALIPTDGGSSRVSLAALRLLEAPLTDLPVLEVYAR